MLAAGLLLLKPAPACSQTQELIFKNYNASDGLNSALVYQVLQDPEQFIWLCTNTGIVRFDGYNFQRFEKKDGFTDYGAYHMLLDSSNRLWFIPFNGKLCYYRDRKIHAPDSDLAILAKYEVVWMEEIRKGLFCIAANNGFFYIIRNNKILYKYCALLHGPSPHFALLNDSLILYPKENKLMLLNINNHEPARQLPTRTMSGVSRFLKINTKRTLVCNKEMIFLLDQTDKGLEITPLNLDPKYFHEESIAIHQDNEGNIWLGNIQGLMMLEKKKNYRFNGMVHLPGRTPSCMITDKEGNHWISTLNHGVYFLHSTHAFRMASESGFPRPVHLITEDKSGNILYYEENKYMYRISSETQAVKEKKTAPYYFIRNAYKSIHYFMMHANTPSSSFWFEQDDPTKPLRWIMEDPLSLKKNREIWLGTDTACNFIIRHYKEEYCFKPVAVAQNLLPALCDSQDNIWFSSKQGLYTFDGDSLIYWGSKHPALSGYIADVKMQSNGRVWVATSNHGLICPNTKPLIHYSDSNGLPTNNIKYIFVENNQVLWLGTNVGALRLTLSPAGKIVSIKAFNINNCLPSNEVNCLYKKNGLLYVGTQTGLMVVDEQKMNPLSVNSPVYILSVSNNVTRYNPGQQISMPHTLNDLQIDYTAIHYASQKNIRYRYKLLPLEDSWKTTHSTQISYSLLPPGKYRFYVSAANAEGVWSDSIASVDFEIRPAFWQTLWFKLLVTGTIILLIVFIIRIRISNARKKDLLHKKIIESELTALRAQMNPHFIFNSLNSIQEFVLNHKPEYANYYLSRFARLMRKIIAYSGQNSISLQQEIEFLNLYVEMEQVRFEKKFIYHLQTDPAIETENTYISPMLIQPIVENAVKYGIALQPENPQLSISIRRDENYLIFRIEDNGPGREFVNSIKKDSGLEHQSMGLKNVEERLQLVGATHSHHIIIEDLFDNNGTAAGTCVTLHVPILKNQNYD